MGGFFLGMSTVVKTFKVTSSSTVADVTGKILSIIADVCLYAGFTLLIVTIVMIIMAFSQENSDAMAKASTTAAVAIGLLSANGLMKAIKNSVIGNVASGADASGNLASIVISFITGAVSYIGITLIPLGLFKLIYSIRQEETAERNTSIKLIVVGVACTAFRLILHAFGI